jgi:hypothetical protein
MKQTNVAKAVQGALSGKVVPTAEQAQHAAIVQEGAQAIFAAVQAATEGAENLWQVIVLCRSEGLTWAELEERDLLDGKGKPIMKDADGNDILGRGGKPRALRLGDLGAYRAAKSRINSMLKAGISLLDGDGAPVSTKAAKELAKGKGKPRGEQGEDGDGATPSVDGADKALHFTDKLQAIEACLAGLHDDAALRKAYSAHIRELAKMIANDEASEKASAEKAARDAAKLAKAKQAADAAAKARTDKAARDAAAGLAAVNAELAQHGLTRTGTNG